MYCSIPTVKKFKIVLKKQLYFRVNWKINPSSKKSRLPKTVGYIFLLLLMFCFFRTRSSPYIFAKIGLRVQPYSKKKERKKQVKPHCSLRNCDLKGLWPSFCFLMMGRKSTRIRDVCCTYGVYVFIVGMSLHAGTFLGHVGLMYAN